MEDIIQKYKIEKKRRNIAIVVTSLALAIVLNVGLNFTDSGKYIQSNILGTSIQAPIDENRGDIYLESIQNSGNTIITLKTSTDMQNIKSFAFSLSYNPEKIDINHMLALPQNTQLVLLGDTPGYVSAIINFELPTTLSPQGEIAQIILPEGDYAGERINMFNVNFTDTDGNMYELTTSGIQLP